jgi:UDP-glucuronate decarboxylase
MKILVTGGAGFLGSHVVARLLGEGATVTSLDNLQTGRMQNIEVHTANPRFRFINADVRNSLPDEAFDEIWNLACPASPPTYQADPVSTLMINILGMKNCLDLAQKYKSKVFQASTSEVYGDPEVHPQPETYKGSVNPIGIRACYDEGKRAAETLCYDYHRHYGVDVRVARIFNTYGPNMDPKDGRVVSNFIVNALQNKPLELYGEGTQTRSFCYVDDLVNGFFALMRAPKMYDTPINIGNPHEFTIKELAVLVKELTQSKSEFLNKPMPKDDPMQRQPAILKAKELLGWQPNIQLREGLMRSIPYFKGQLNG